MKTIGIVGSRRRDSDYDYQETRKLFDLYYEEGDRIVSGHCPKGGDRFAEIIAAELGLTEKNGGLILHRPEWNKYGKGAGFVRNTYIAEDADILIAVVAADRTGGTEDTIKKALKMGKRVVYVVAGPLACSEEFDPLKEV
jgi:predicted Rossmann fold nucleotide-binding protein DprA/Smf involved in DNA uptake